MPPAQRYNHKKVYLGHLNVKMEENSRVHTPFRQETTNCKSTPYAL